MDWTDTTRLDRFEYEMVDPFNLDKSRGWLEGVTEASITYGYYTDTRYSADLTAVNPQYIENSLMRVHHYVDSEGYHEELGTFFVTEITPTRTHGADLVTFRLESMLARVSDDRLAANYAIKVGDTAKGVLADLFKRHDMAYRFEPGCPDMTYKSATVYEVGDSVLSTLFDIVNLMGARMSVDGHGTVTVSKYVEPSTRTSSVTLYPDAPDSMVVGEITESTDFYSTPNRYVVTHKDGDLMVYGHADTPSTVGTSYSRRGRRVTSVDDVDSLSPATNAGAAAKAASNLALVQGVSTEVEFNTLYFPLGDGEVITLAMDGNERRLMLKSRDVTLRPGMECRNTFKEV